MQLRQMNLAYDRQQDRLLMRLSTSDDTEYRMWLTRRMVAGMWPGIVQLVQSTTVARQAVDPGTKRAVVEFQREHALRETQFGAPYEAAKLTPAIPGEPILVWGIQMRPAPDGNGHDINFLPKEGAGVHIRLQDQMLHAWIKLLQDVMTAADWGLTLELPIEAAGAAPAAGGEPPKPVKPN